MLIYDNGFNNLLTKDPLFTDTVNSANSFSDGTNASFLTSGDLTGNLTMTDGFMQSSNFVTGSTGWKIDKDGNVEFDSGYFRGDITGASGAFSGSLTAGTIDIGGSDASSWHVDIDGNMWWGSAGSYAAATIKISSAGSVNFTTGNFSGSLNYGKTSFSDSTNAGYYLSSSGVYIGSASDTKYFKYDVSAGTITLRGTLNADDITAGTLAGRTVKATGGNTDVVMDSADGKLKFKDGGTEKGFMYCDGSGNMQIDADNLLYLTADGTGDDIALIADDTILLSADIIALNADNSLWLEYNANGGDNICIIANDGSSKFTVRDNGDCHVEAGNMYANDYNINDYAEYFEATKEFSSEKIPLGTSVVLDSGLVRPAKKNEEPFGVISASSFIHSGGAGNDEWKGKYLREELGEIKTEKKEKWYIQVEEKFKKVTGQKGSKKVWKSDWCDKSPAPKDAIIRIKERPILNPEYDDNKKYIKREDRPEWNNVGLLGQVPILKGQPTNPNWIKLKDISDKYEMWLIK
jgi:hypothetical protein